MGDVAEKVLTIALRGFVRGKDTTEDVHELSEILVTMTVEVEEKAFELIAKYQPVASDLRIINSYIKIAYDFERYGRYAWDIAFINKRVGNMKKCEAWILEHIADMSEKVLEMVKVSVNSLKSHDVELAQMVSKTEPEVDNLYFEFLDKLVKEAHATNQCTISSLLAVRYLERVADHATYVSEAVVYIATGKKIMLR
jgi:phosphate transport system protein